LAGLLVGEWLLGRAVRRRRAEIAEQFPVAAQLLALLISAGSAPAAAVGRVGRAVGGPLGAQFEAAAQRTAAGDGFPAAMRQLAEEVDLPVVERFVHGLLAAIERGSPLAEIVREQAIDASAEAHRQLMTAAGKRDIAMLVPVVFAVLPTVVMVSLLPGALQLGLFGQ
jgi:tight adherence protein C